MLSFGSRVPGSGSCSKTYPGCTSAFGSRTHLGLEPVVDDQVDGVALEDAGVVARPRAACSSSIWSLDVVVEEPAADRRARARRRARAATATTRAPVRTVAVVGAVALVAAVGPAGQPAATRRRGGRSRRAAAPSSRPSRSRPRPASPRADELEVAIHLLRRAVAVGRLLRERAEHDEVEVARDLGADRRRGLRHLREVLHRDLDRRLAGERHGRRSAARRGRSRSSRDRSSRRPARRAPARARGTAPCRRSSPPRSSRSRRLARCRSRRP